MTETFDIFLIAMAALALVVYVALHFFEAGYGYLFDRRYGFPVSNKLGWMLMEAPVFVAMTILWLLSDRTWQAAPLVLFLMFQSHYLYRSGCGAARKCPSESSRWACSSTRSTL